MASSVNSTAVQVPAVIRESDGALLVWTSGGYKTLEEANVSLNSSTSVSIESLETGADEVQEWRRSVPAGLQGHDIDPLETPSGPMPWAEPLGTSGAQGDLLLTINTFPFTNPPTDAAVYILLDDEPDVLYGTAGTAPAEGATTLALTASEAIAVGSGGSTIPDATVARAFARCVAWLEYIPPGVTHRIRVYRTITGHAAASGASISLVVDHGVPAGGAILEWGIRPKKSARQIALHNDGPREIALHRQSTSDGFSIAVDRGVSVMTGGQYT